MPTEDSSDFWFNKNLTGVSDVEKFSEQTIEWLREQPLVAAMLSVTDPINEKAYDLFPWLKEYEDIKMFPALMKSVVLAFLETSHGINRAYNSKAHSNLAAAGEKALSSAVSTSTEKGIYGDAINAFNVGLNIPEVSKLNIKVNQDVSSAWQSLINKREEMLAGYRNLKEQLFKQLESIDLVGKARRLLRKKYNELVKSLTGMGEKPTPAPVKGGIKPTPSSGGSGIKAPSHFRPGFGFVIAHNPYEINSIYNDRILSIRSIEVNASALVIVPIVTPIVAVTGALATVGITAGIISTIATWFMGTAMNLVGMPASLIPALTHCVTSIVLKVSGSAGAEALRYFAASALKANATSLMTVFGASSMNITTWLFLTAMALPILLVSVIIILAMKSKVLLSEMLYIFADIKDKPGMFNLSQAHMYDTNPKEILEQFKTSARRLMANSILPIEKIIGIGLTDKKEYAICYDLTKPDEPVKLSGDAMLAAIGADKIAKIATGNFFFDWS